MKKIYISIWITALLLVTVFGGSASAKAQTSSAPVLYNQTGGVVNGYDSAVGALNSGWYYSESGNPRYYYANGVFYDPATQSYGGSILYPGAFGPQSVSTGAAESPLVGNLTPGVPNTGMGGVAVYAWLALILSAATAVVGTAYLTRNAP